MVGENTIVGIRGTILNYRNRISTFPGASVADSLSQTGFSKC